MGFARKSAVLAATAGLLLAGCSTPAAQASSRCSSLAEPEVPGAEVVSTTAEEHPGGTIDPPPVPPDPTPPIENVPPHCAVTIVLTHPGAHDEVTVEVWLPLENWNGRFQGTGGAGWSTGVSAAALAPAVKNGYAAAATDGGHELNSIDPSRWALDEQGEVNLELLENFASRSLHDMTVVGKAVTADFYGEPARYSYWNGCSTGGRQGFMEAQRYPGDYDGILASAPAINWERFTTASQWPHVVMHEAGVYPSPCEFEAFTEAAIEACDGADGVVDGVIGDPLRCGFDPAELVGTQVLCDGEETTISAETAEVVRKIWDGPRTSDGERLWYGLTKGTLLSNLTTPGPDGTMRPATFPIADSWVRYFLKQDPEFDASALTTEEFEELFEQAQRDYNDIIGTDDPDLSEFRESGGKLLTWHGMSDSLIYPQGTIRYWHEVVRALGGQHRVDDFFRVFLAPGAEHCSAGRGPAPVDPLGALVEWVENGNAPDTLPAAKTDGSGQVITRDLCPYPQVAQYDGEGDPNQADNYRCTTA
jgi:hypothetical protein